MVVAVWDNPELSGEPAAFYWHFSGNSGGYLFNPPYPGPWYAIAMYMAGGLLNDGPSIGDGVYVYNSGCSLPPTALNVSAPMTANGTLSDSCVMQGVYGSAFYYGSYTVSSTVRIRTAAYTDPLYQTSTGFQEDVQSNGDRYDLICSVGSSAVSLYQLAWLDLDNNGALDIDEPYDGLGPFPPGTGTTRDIFLSDNKLWTGRFLQGKVYYESGAVNSTNMILAYASCMADLSGCGGSGDTAAAVIVNGGYYHVPVPTAYSTYYMAFIYNASGVSMVEGPHVGDTYEIYNDTCDFTPAAIDGSAGSVLMPDVSFSNACSLYGVRGNVNYTPGGVDDSHRVGVRAYQGSGYTGLIQDTRRSTNNTRWDIVTTGNPGITPGTTVYLRAYYDNDGNGYDTGDNYNDMGGATVDYGSGNTNISFNGSLTVP
jgi:hypothetical protein